MKLKVVSYNIFHCENYWSEKIEFDNFAQTMKSFDADVIALNEVHGEGVDEEYQEQAKILGEKIGYNYYFAKACDIDGPNPFGNAVLTRLPIKKIENVPIPDPEPKAYDGYYETRCILKMTVDTTPEVTFYITHFGLNPDEQDNAVKTLLENLDSEYSVLMGDLNVKPDNKVLDRIREVLCDTAKEVTPELYSFPADKPDRKIDYIFVSKNIKTENFRVPEIILSDHRPVEAVIEI
ncbi:MAG: endonuclease/exonuclease/phosphatase family protein [Ruminococcus sp.]|nr:endonuclease/exonuclease/phosphatase family protein [Candidatus Copronaster equi]